MIELRNLSKVYYYRGKRKVIIDNVNAVFPTGGRVALLGRNGAGKSTLLKIIAGTTAATSGEVISDGTISWPVGFAGSFHGDLTGAQNVRFVARIYGIDSGELVDYVEDFADLGRHFHQPIRSYSAGMKSRLSFGVSMGIPFDTYLVDETTSVGDEAFRRKSVAVFNDRMSKAGAFVVTHSMNMVRQMCNIGVVLENGRMIVYDDLDTAIEHHIANMED